MRDSIFYSSIRSLFVAFCAVVGIGLGIVFFSIIVGVLSTSTESNLKTVSTEEILPNAEGQREVLSKKAPIILQVDVDGIIGTEGLSAHSIKQQLIESREGDYKDDRVKGVLININTPGGTVVDADGIYRALKEYKELYKVPVYAFVDGLCASGGMYVASSADKIYATDVSIIGSVGVIAPTFMNFTKLMEKIGVEALTISAGKDKDALNPLRPWKPDEDKNYKELIEYYYQHFVNVVTSNRSGINKEKLIQDYGARVFNAESAQEHGFIDSGKSTLKEALKDLVKAANIEGNYQVIRLERKDWWSMLFADSKFTGLSTLLTGKITHQLQLTPDLDPALQNKFLYMYSPNLK